MKISSRLSPCYARRRFLQRMGAIGLGSMLGGSSVFEALAQTSVSLPFVNGERPLVQFPGKKELLQLSARPPQLETPLSVFDTGITTPNDQFYVRYHNSFIFGEQPVGTISIEPDTFRLKVYGLVNNPLTLSVNQLKNQFRSSEITAVCQCAGNSRGFSNPRVRGSQWGHGAMGNAHWKGVALTEILGKAGVDPSAVRIELNGLDVQAFDLAPDYRKSLPLDVALNGEVLVAYAMNGKDLPMLNGFPLRLVVPGYYATYWVKHLTDISVVNTSKANYYMDEAYRIPDNACNCVTPGTQASKTVAVSRMKVRSFFTNVEAGAQLARGKHVIRGIAFDGSGSGIKAVDFSSDGGLTWQATGLGVGERPYSFRRWQIDFNPASAGEYELRVRATNGLDETQPLQANWNPGGYNRNVSEAILVTVV